LAGKNDQEPALQELQTFTDLSYWQLIINLAKLKRQE
jgi:hypothetical protein